LISKWLALGVGRVHPMDHPIVPPGLKQGVAALDALAVEAGDDLLLLDLLRLIGALVPDGHLPRPVLALRDRSVEVQVLDRVVLGVDGEPVLARILRNATGQREREQHPVVLEPQVPVQAAGVVLVDDEAVAVSGGLSLALAARLRRLRRISLGPVGLELVGGLGLRPFRHRWVIVAG
jgi:hypothetical protein